MMGGFGGGMGFGGIGMLLFWGLLIAAVVLLVRWFGSGSSATFSPWARGKSALEILGERYAKGEIGKDEYEQKRRDLGTD
jgi:putative membrane protein